jgi:hypothetical protein
MNPCVSPENIGPFAGPTGTGDDPKGSYELAIAKQKLRARDEMTGGDCIGNRNGIISLSRSWENFPPSLRKLWRERLFLAGHTHT